MFGWDTRTAHEALPTMDAAVFMQTAEPPASAAGRDLLGGVGRVPVTTFTVLNKAGHLDPPGLAEALEFTGRACQRDAASITRVTRRSRSAGAP